MKIGWKKSRKGFDMSETEDHEHLHQHDPGHKHPLQPDQDDTITYFKAMEAAVRELLIEKDLITAEQIRVKIEQMDALVPANGAKIIAKSWMDDEFKNKLIEDPRKAISEFGYDIGPLHLIVLENTERVHNVVVCTLCSCYPRWILGLPPDWYKSREYRSRVVREPREVLKEFGTHISLDREVRVHDSTADMRYLVLPMRPKGSESMTEEDLVALIGRDAMIGVTEVSIL